MHAVMPVITAICRLLILASVLIAPVAAHAGRIVRLTSGEWPPYHSQTLPDYGVVSHVVTEAFRLQGVDVQYGFFPWRRALELSRIGKWDGAASWLKNPARERDFYVSDPIFDGHYFLFHLKETPLEWSTIADLSKYRLGITQEYFYGEEFAAALKEGKLTAEAVPSEEQNFRKLLAGRIDAFPINDRVAFAILSKHFSSQDIARLSFDPKPLYSPTVHLLLNRKNPENRKLMDEFNLGLKKLKASGRFDAYMRGAPTLNDTTAIK
jgi:polar amino acid transport system substrate-binding protein